MRKGEAGMRNRRGVEGNKEEKWGNEKGKRIGIRKEKKGNE